MFNDDFANEMFEIITHYDKCSKKLHLIDVYWIICNNSLVSTTIEEYLKELIWNFDKE